jgi:hypothetical protein
MRRYRERKAGEAGEYPYHCFEGAHPSYCRGVHGAIWQPGRSLTQAAALIVILLLSLGLWGIIWLAVAFLSSVQER